MNSAKKFILIFLISFMQSAWSSNNSVAPFNIQAGSKKLIFKKDPNIEWRQFCFDTPLGCARFNYNNGKSEDISGYVRVLTEKITAKEFDKYCKEVFDISTTYDKSLNSFEIDTKSIMQHCSWKGKKDVVNFFWKDGTTILVNTSDSFNAKSILSEARINEKL